MLLRVLPFDEKPMGLTRRQFTGVLAAPFVRGAGNSPSRFSDYPAGFSTDIQDHDPHIKAFDLRNLTTWETPAQQIFTFHQTRTVSDVDLSKWRLEVGGSVARPRAYTYAELVRYAAQQTPATIECAGNSGHSRLMNGLVSNAIWTGPLLAPLLRECGVLPEAREVVFFGADVERERKWPVGDREFAAAHGRSLFVQDAMDGRAILALQLNGRPLPPEHGYPVRLIVPGWYGMAQVKWLNRIVVLDRRYEGRHMARNYHSVRVTGPEGLVIETSIGRTRLKSVVARIEQGKAGGYVITGAAWGGLHPIDKVAVRIDGTVREARIVVRNGSPDAWSLWQADWPDAAPGPHTVVSSAINSRGEVQPERTGLVSSREDNAQWPRQVLIPPQLRETAR